MNTTNTEKNTQRKLRIDPMHVALRELKTKLGAVVVVNKSPLGESRALRIGANTDATYLTPFVPGGLTNLAWFCLLRKQAILRDGRKLLRSYEPNTEIKL